MNGKSQRERAFVFVAAGASSADSASRSKSTRVVYNQIQFPQLQKERDGEDDVNATGEYNQSFYPKRNPTQQRDRIKTEKEFQSIPKVFFSPI